MFVFVRFKTAVCETKKLIIIIINQIWIKKKFSFLFFVILYGYRSEISLLYNDRSVLENFHISEAFRVMRKDDANIVANLSREEYR